MLEGGLVEGLSLDLGDLELLGGGLAGAVAAGEGAGAPGAASVDLGEVGQLAEGLVEAEGHVDDAVVGQGGHGRDGGGLLAAALGGGADEEAGELAVVAAGGPLLAGLVPEGLPLGGEVAEAGGDPDQEGVVLGEGGGVLEDLDVGGLGAGAQLGQDLGGECLGDLEDVGGAAGGLDALQLGLRELLDVPVEGVLRRRELLLAKQCIWLAIGDGVVVWRARLPYAGNREFPAAPYAM